MSERWACGSDGRWNVQHLNHSCCGTSCQRLRQWRRACTRSNAGLMQLKEDVRSQAVNVDAVHGRRAGRAEVRPDRRSALRPATLLTSTASLATPSFTSKNAVAPSLYPSLRLRLLVVFASPIIPLDRIPTGHLRSNFEQPYLRSTCSRANHQATPHNYSPSRKPVHHPFASSTGLIHQLKMAVAGLKTIISLSFVSPLHLKTGNPQNPPTSTNHPPSSFRS